MLREAEKNIPRHVNICVYSSWSVNIDTCSINLWIHTFHIQSNRFEGKNNNTTINSYPLPGESTRLKLGKEICCVKHLDGMKCAHREAERRVSHENTCPTLAFSQTKVSWWPASSGGNSLMSSTLTATATRLVSTGLSGEGDTTQQGFITRARCDATAENVATEGTTVPRVWPEPHRFTGVAAGWPWGLKRPSDLERVLTR